MTEVATKDITIQGLEFEVTAPYTEGHTCTEAEAKALNQTRHENIRNNMARVVKAKMKEAEVEKVEDLTDEQLTELAEAVADYDESYEFTLASVGGGRKSRDPYEVEATKIARAAITAMLKENGQKVSDYEKEKLDAAIAKIAEKPEVIAQAKKNVDERNALAATALADLDLG